VAPGPVALNHEFITKYYDFLILVLQVIAAPLDKLTGKFGAILSDIGPPEVLINAVGPYMTGTYAQGSEPK